MARVCTIYVAVIFVVSLFACQIDCKRGGGFGRPSSHSRPSGSRPSYSRPAPAPAPSPSYHRPAPAPSTGYGWNTQASKPAPAPSYGWNTNVAKPAPAVNPYKPSAPLPPQQSNYGVNQGISKQHVGQQHSSAPGYHGNSPQGPPIQSGVHTPVQGQQSFGVAPLKKPGQPGYSPIAASAPQPGQSSFGINKPPPKPGQPGYSPIAASAPQPGQSSFGINKPPPKPGQPGYSPIAASAPQPGQSFGINKPASQPGHSPIAASGQNQPGQSNFGINKQAQPPAYSPIASSANNPVHGAPITSVNRQPVQSGYPQQGQYNPQGQHPYPVQPPAYSQYPQPGHYGGGYGGYNQNPHYGGYGVPPPAYPGYGGYGGGGFGGMGGYGGYGGGGGGGFGGMGGFGGGYSPYRQSNNGWKYFLGGALVATVISNVGSIGRSRDYTVYNYYNRGIKKEDIQVESNTIIGCPQNASFICPDGTFNICTSDSKILCVTSATVPCNSNTTASCVHSTFTPPPCVNGTSPAGPCNETTVFNTTTVNIPCITNASIMGDLKDINATVLNSTLFLNGSMNGGKIPSHFCVTTIAIPRDPPPEVKKIEPVMCSAQDDASLSISKSPFGNGTIVLNTTLLDSDNSIIPWPVVTNLVNVDPVSRNAKKCVNGTN